MKLLTLLLALAPFGASAFSPDLTRLASEKGVTLTKREARVARIGEISQQEYVWGGVLGSWPVGLGLGHVVQGRWQDDGKFFTYTQGGALGLMLISGPCVGKLFKNDDNDCGGPLEAIMLAGLVSYVGLRVWEIIDVWRAPPRQNRRYHYLRARLEQMPDPEEPKASLDVVPLMSPQGGGVGLRLKF